MRKFHWLYFVGVVLACGTVTGLIGFFSGKSGFSFFTAGATGAAFANAAVQIYGSMNIDTLKKDVGFHIIGLTYYKGDLYCIAQKHGLLGKPKYLTLLEDDFEDQDVYAELSGSGQIPNFHNVYYKNPSSSKIKLRRQ